MLFDRENTYWEKALHYWRQGRFDLFAVYYLRARGIPTPQAIRMVTNLEY